MEDGTAIIQSYLATDLIKVFAVSRRQMWTSHMGKNSF